MFSCRSVFPSSIKGSCQAGATQIEPGLAALVDKSSRETGARLRALTHRGKEVLVKMRLILSFVMIFLASGLAAAEPPLSVERLLAEGWEIAGYASGYDNRTSLILFRHAGTNALVQCGVLYDVTRNPRTIVNCYELR